MNADIHHLTGCWVDEVWNRKREETIHELLDPHVVGHTEGGDIVGVDAFIRLFHRPFLQAFPDMRVRILSLMSEGDQSVFQWEVEATHLGLFLDIIPTGRRIKFCGMSWFSFRNGRIVEAWDRWNLNGLMSLLAEGNPCATAQLVRDRGLTGIIPRV